MRFTKVLLLFSCLLAFAIAKPAYINDQINDRYEEAEESDYDAIDDEGGVEESAELQDEANVKDSRANYDAEEEVTNSPESVAEKQMRQRARYHSRLEARADAEDNNADEESEQNVQDLSEDSDENPDPQSNRQRSSMDYENEERPRPRQHTPSRNHYKYNRQREYIAKKNNRMSQEQNLDDEATFENSVHNQKQRYSNAEYSDANDDSDYESVRNYNTMNAKNNKAKMDSGFYGNNTANRQRRQANTQNATSAPVEKTADVVAKKEEEAAIKRHIDKLTTDELEQLLNTLSEDKRTLLTKIIMDNDKNVNSAKMVDNIDVKKREITKKAGAMNENNLIDSNQLDEKAQGGADISSDVTNLLNANGTINNNVVETENITDTTQSAIIADKTEVNLLANAPEPAADPTPKSSDPEQQSGAKTANKREARYDHRAEDSDLMEQNLSDEQENFCNQDDQLTDYANEESDMYENNNIHKRDIYDQENSEIDDSRNSLEDSFPNSNTYDEIDSGSDMEPHVRVKRKNPDLVVKKRAAALLPESKVAYVPYKSENEDEDTAEANEFDDDGFYVRANNFEGDVHNKEARRSKVLRGEQCSNNKRFNFRASDSYRQESDAVGVGSDSDSVLSGSEGVDDNLMFNNAARNKRSANVGRNVGAEYTNESEDAEKSNDRAEMAAESQKLTDNNMNLAFQENDAFGPLPRNYEGELNRYKRIRRVKHVPASHNNE